MLGYAFSDFYSFHAFIFSYLMLFIHLVITHAYEPLHISPISSRIPVNSKY